MNITTANRLKAVRPSSILGLVQKAKAMSAQGHPVIDLGIGEPDFDTPDHIQMAAKIALSYGQTKYTPVPGTIEARQAIVRKFERENGLTYTPDEITVTGGAKQAIYNALMATVSPGDEVIIPAPYWSSYPDMVAMAEGQPIILDCPQEQRFLLDPAQFEAAITPKTRWLMLNSPSNPTGNIYRPENLTAIAEVLRRHPHVMVLSDDIYEHLMFDDLKFCSILNVAPDLQDRVLVVNGVSKVFAMTGWRLGYAAGPKDLIKAMNTVQGQSTSHASSIAQAATIAALDGPTDFFAERASQFEMRRDLVVNTLGAVDGIDMLTPEGAFYVFPKVAGLIGKVTPKGKVLGTDADVCDWLLDDHYVSCVPGSAFGLSPHIRISTASSTQNLQEACERIAAAVSTLTGAA